MTDTSMSILNTLSLEHNRKLKLISNWWDLFSDVCSLLIKELVSKVGIAKLFNQSSKTNDSALFLYHTDKENLLQMVYMTVTGYFGDDA